ncbi:MAG TPA: dihydropteroate synthase [Actinomycetota bacterium]|nr:dihydropteroate synthase [Actinomycetota bacterium]
MIIDHATGRIETERCLVMGIVNRTPDSFYDGGRMDLRKAVEHGLRLVEEGADLVDVGGVKGGPGADVSETEEIARVVPLLEQLAARTDAPLSLETGRPRIAAAGLGAGASFVNDVTALADPGLAPAAAEGGAALVLMHNGGQLRGRPRNPRYADVVAAVAETWDGLAAVARDAGVGEHSLVFDPGLDFGKTTGHSLELVRRLDELVARGDPVLVAPSRKDVVGETLGLGLHERLEGTLALVALSVAAGASIVRVHDVRPAVRVVRMVEAVMGRRAPAAPVRGLWE